MITPFGQLPDIIPGTRKPNRAPDAQAVEAIKNAGGSVITEQQFTAALNGVQNKTPLWVYGVGVAALVAVGYAAWKMG